MQQAIHNNRRGGPTRLARLRNHLSLLGTLTGELIALASLVAALAAGLAVLTYLVA